MTLANYVTLARIALIPLVVSFLYLGFYGLAAIFFVLLSLSDALDGYIARRLNQVSDLGKFLDPLADKVLVIIVLIALVELKRAETIPVMLITAREFLVSGIRTHAAHKNIIIAASPLAKLKTVSQVIAVIMLILRFPYAGEALWVAVALSFFSGGAYLWRSKILK